MKKTIGEIEIEGRQTKIIISDEMGNLIGQCDHLEPYIMIRNGLDKKTTFAVIVHEVTHFVIFEKGFQQTRWTEESICDFLGSNIVEIMSVSNEVKNIIEKGEAK